MRARKKVIKIKKKTKVIFCISVVVLALIYLLYVFDYSIRPVIYQFTETQTRLLSILAINDAVINQTKLFSEEYSQLTQIKYDTSGKITSIQINSQIANVLKERLLQEINKKLIDMQSQQISVPLGTLLNWTLFSGIGPEVKLKIIPLSHATAEIVSSLDSAGVNQSIHKINVIINVDMCALIPGYSKTTAIKNEVLISQTVIVGDVPTVHFSDK